MIFQNPSRALKYAAAWAFLVVAACVVVQRLSAAPRHWAMKPGFHVTTKAEREREYSRQLKAMNDAGFYGDPPISNGFAGFTLGKDDRMTSGEMQWPGYFTDGKTFETSYALLAGERTCEVTREEWESRYDRKKQGKLVYLTNSEVRFAALLDACRSGELPLHPELPELGQ